MGEFLHGKKHDDNGTFKWNDHPKYTEYNGNFVQNKIKGKGKLTMKNGTVIQGTFDEDSIRDATCFA